jgi:hypothetical protein
MSAVSPSSQGNDLDIDRTVHAEAKNPSPRTIKTQASFVGTDRARPHYGRSDGPSFTCEILLSHFQVLSLSSDGERVTRTCLAMLQGCDSTVYADKTEPFCIQVREDHS